jgi:hypothetical protein
LLMNKIVFAIKLFIISTTGLFTIRTICLVIGKKVDQKSCRWSIFIGCFLNICSFFATKNKIFVFLMLIIGVLAAIYCIKRNTKPIEEQIEGFFDHLIMSMRSGMSLESVLLDLEAFDPYWKLFFADCRTNDQPEIAKEITNVLKFCRARPTQSCGIIEKFRHSLRLRSKLNRKHRMISLQSKAQALVSLFLFVVIMIFQFFSVPEFRDFLKHSEGKLTLAFSVALMLLGIAWIFKIGSPGDFQI